ncbi:MAG: hypothetical protein IKI02_00755 [Oscillospiraceae bacterium]|nr:hypothetical protein [Oscillospiraceae bacterium]
MYDELIRMYHPGLPPLLAELAGTPAMERLKQVGMNCGCEYTAFPRFAEGGSYSRWLHSLGVGLIVWHFTGDPAQAAAGLLHDVATPTFAHVVDFLRGDYLVQEATEDGTRERIEESPEIQAVLARYGLTTEAVCDYHRYPIADNDSPRLSADRLEYTLGNSLRWGFLNREEIAAIYNDLQAGINEEGAPELVFGHSEPAAAFARAALECAKIYVCDADRYSMQALCELLGKALKSGVLSPADLDGTEPPLIAKLEASPLAADWQAFRSMNRTLLADAPPDARPWRQIPAKKRRIDPLAEGMGRVSAWDDGFRADLADFLSRKQDEWLLGICGE